MVSEKLLKVWENDLKVFEEWLKTKEGGKIYINLPDEVQSVLVRGQIETRQKINAMKNDYL